MTKVHLTAEKLQQYLDLVFPEPSDPENLKAVQRVTENRIWAEYLFSQGKGNQAKGVAGTLWAAYNGVAELIDHRQAFNQTPDRRLDSVWFGDGYLVKARAFEFAKKMAA